jgi:hypothetical protein
VRSVSKGAELARWFCLHAAGLRDWLRTFLQLAALREEIPTASSVRFFARGSAHRRLESGCWPTRDFGDGTGGCRSQAGLHHRAAKGARNQHQVPVTDDFRPIYEEYLRTERGAAPDVHAVWIASRKGQGKALAYASFESALCYIGRRAGISAHPQLCRHTLAQGVLEATGNIKAVQEISGHSHLSTTADLYLCINEHAMVIALAAAKSSTERATKQHSWPSAKAAQYAFADDDETISELERAIAQASGVEPPGGDS